MEVGNDYEAKALGTEEDVVKNNCESEITKSHESENTQVARAKSHETQKQNHKEDDKDKP